MKAPKIMVESGYQRKTSGPVDDNVFIKEWDQCASTKSTDTTIGIWIEDNKIQRVRFFTDKFASKTGSYYKGKIEFSEPQECTPELLTKLEHCIARVALGSHKELKEQFNAEPQFTKMS